MARLLKRYRNGEYVVSHGMGIHLNGAQPSTEIDLTDLPDDQFEEIITDPSNEKLINEIDTTPESK